MITKKDLCYVMVGSMVGINTDVKDFLIEQRKYLNQETVHVFIHMWDFWENNIWFQNFRKAFEPVHGIKFHVTTEAYNSKECWGVTKKFLADVGPTSFDPIPAHICKRVWYWYSLSKAMKAVHDFDEDLYVQTIYPDSTLTDQFGYARPLDWLYRFLSQLYVNKSVSYPPEIARQTWDNIILTEEASPYYIKEEYLFGHIGVFKRLLLNFDIKELFETMGQLYVSQYKKAGVKKPTTQEAFKMTFNNTSIIANEASYYLYKLWEPFKEEIAVMKFNFWTKRGAVSNPWFSVAKDYIKLSFPMDFKVSEPHLNKKLYWYGGNFKKMEELGSNIAGSIRENKK